MREDDPDQRDLHRDLAPGSVSGGPVGSSRTGWALGRPLIWGHVQGNQQIATFSLPAGTVTFLLSDIEGSTRLWQDDRSHRFARICRARRLSGRGGNRS